MQIWMINKLFTLDLHKSTNTTAILTLQGKILPRYINIKELKTQNTYENMTKITRSCMSCFHFTKYFKLFMFKESFVDLYSKMLKFGYQYFSLQNVVC